MATDSAKSGNRTEPHFLAWLFTNRVTLGLAALVALLTVFYVEEDVRGKWAWQRCHRQLRADGQVLDWNAFVPAAVPEAENVFSAPRMKDWFVFGGSNDLILRTNKVSLANYLNERGLGKVAEIAIVPLGTKPASGLQDADLVLSYDHSVLTLVRKEAWEAPSTDSPSPILPLIVMEDVPLADAIRNLAAQARIKCAFAPEVSEGYVPEGKPQPRVTLRWKDVTARQALISLLGNYGLLLVENPKTRVALIKADDSAQPRVYVDEDAGEQLKRRVRQAISTNEAPYANGSQGFKLLARTLPTKPFRILLQADQTPSPPEMKQLFPADMVRGFPAAGTKCSVEHSGTNTFTVSLAPSVTPAADYVGWSDRFSPDLDLIREALKRPSVRIDGDYSQPFSQPRLDNSSIRIVAQTLAQRAQCFLLLGEPEKALHEMTLLHDMNRLMEAKPVTLIAAMHEVAITGVYVNVIEDGFRLHAWREPQLAALQEQLKDINLLHPLHSAFLSQRVEICQLLESQTATTVEQVMTIPSTTQTFWQQLRNPKSLLLWLAPRGWNQQSMVLVAKFAGKYLEGVDAVRQIIFPQKMDACAFEVQSSFNRVNPQNYLAAICLPNFKQACQTLARTQALVKEAQIACALERHRLAHGEFPEKLDSLVPVFLKILPADVIKGGQLHYRRKDADHFQLYSIGWNETDEGGIAVRDENGVVFILDQGDWPWDPLQDRK